MGNAIFKVALNQINQIAFDNASIPKIIHFTTRDKNLVGEIKANVDRIRMMNPDWTVVIYDDADIENFLEENYGSATLQAYRRLNPRYGAAKADFFRYLCIYKKGGLYLDIKSTSSMPLNEWLSPQDRFIVSQWNNELDGPYSNWGLHKELEHMNGGEYQQWFIAASAGHPFLRAVCERVLNNIASYGPFPARFGRPGVLRLTGPIAFTLAIHPILAKFPHRQVKDIEKECGLEYSIYKVEREHFKLSAVHYSALKEPVVKLGLMANFIFSVARAFQEGAAELKSAAIKRALMIKRFLLPSQR